jgi:hypothetical protein
MMRVQLPAPDPDEPYESVERSLLVALDQLVEERPEMIVLAPDDGSHEEAKQLRATCQGVLDLLSEVSDALPEKTFVDASDMLMKLFSFAAPREAHGRTVFVARALHDAYQRLSDEHRVCGTRLRASQHQELEMRKEIAQLRQEVRDHEAARVKDQERIKRLVKLNSAAAEAGRILETQADALRRKKCAR